MSRFYERYGHIIVLAVSGLSGAIAVALLLFIAAETVEALPLRHSLLNIREYLVQRGSLVLTWIAKNAQIITAIVTTCTFIFGVYNGVRFARRYLPMRLMQLMDEQMAPVYQSPDAIYGSVNSGAIAIAHQGPFVIKGQLDRALDALGHPWRPRSEASLDETIAEACKHIELSEARLTRLRDLRDHAFLLRGAVASQIGSGDAASCTEQDFTSAAENPRIKADALELRGLVRLARGNLAGAIADFSTVSELRENLGTTLKQARARRHWAEAKIKESTVTGAGTLNQVQRELNNAKALLDNGRTLSDDEHIELGHNRFAYGLLKTRLDDIVGNQLNLAIQAYEAAALHFDRAKSQDAKRLAERARSHRSDLTI